MKKLILLLLFIPLVSFSQKSNDADALKLCVALQSNNFTTDAEAEDAVNKILSVIGASQKPVLQACSNINNAVAAVYKGQRYILYDRDFMNSLSAGGNKYWSNMFILAHEMGHHINGHSLDIVLYASDIIDPKSLEEKRKQELEADEFAGFVIGKLGSTLTQIERILSNLPPITNEKASTHPSKSKRILAVRKGFNKTITKKNDIKLSNTKTNPAPSRVGINIPNFENPRMPDVREYGSWEKTTFWKLENTGYYKEKDPFEKKDYKTWAPIRRVTSRGVGTKIGYEGFRFKSYRGVTPVNNGALTLTIEQSIFDYYDPDVKSNKYISIRLENFQEMPPVIVTETKRSSWNIEDHSFEYDNEFHFYKVGDKIYYVTLRSVEEFKKRYPEYIYLDKIVYEEKITSENPDIARGIFSYMIDNQYSGQFLGNIGGYSDSTYPSPQTIFLNNWGVNPKGQKKNREFIDLLKKGKKLYLKFDKLWYYKGKLDSGEFDLSGTDKSYKIESYTYEIDLTGSSKALQF